MSTLRTYAQLCRLPAVFTAISDVVMGFFVLNGSIMVAHPVRLAGLIVATIGLYLSGMVLNDIFDRDVDARERPNRPIPSGRVSLFKATVFALILILVGLTGAAVAGKTSLVVALTLLGAIFLYDASAKKTPLGPVAMGSCRFLNVLLGGTLAVSSVTELLATPLVIVAVSMWIYVAGVTWFARNEAEERSSVKGLILGQSVMNLGLIGLAAFMAPQLEPLWASLHRLPVLHHTDPWRSLVMLGIVAVVLNRRAVATMGNPVPRQVQSTVRIMLLSLITLNATLIYAALGEPGVPIAALVVALLVPSFVLGRWMTMT